MIIRRMEEKDLPQIQDLLMGFGEGTPEIEKMKEVFAKYKENEHYVYLCAEIEDKVAGTLTGVICHSLFTQFSPFMVLENVIVSNEHRGKGIGKLMMKSMEKIAREKGCKEVMFVSSAHRKEAHRFYESLGYKLDVVQGFRKAL